MYINGNQDFRSAEFRELFLASRAGDRRSLGALLLAIQPYLSIQANSQFRRVLLPRISPDDIVQETLLKVFVHFQTFQGESELEFRGWLKKILTRVVLSLVERHLLTERRDLRRENSVRDIRGDLRATENRLEELLWARGTTPEMRLQRKEDLILLADLLAMLPTDYQTVLRLRNLEELSFKEVARQMDRSVGATRMLWGRAIECLKKAYADSLLG